MTKQKDDEKKRSQLTLVLSRLLAIKRHLPLGDVTEDYVQLFHQSLNELQPHAACDLSSLRIAESSLFRHQMPASADVRTGELINPQWSEERYCERAYFLAQVNTALTYFRFEQHPSRRPIDVQPPKLAD